MVKLTERETVLLLRAKEVLENCQHCYLTGSLMLKLRGVNLDRECSDLDFCVDDDRLTQDERIVKNLYPIGQTSIFIPTNFQICGSGYGDLVQLKNEKDAKIDYFYQRERLDFTTNHVIMPSGKTYPFRLGFIGDLLKKKEMIIENTSHEHVIEKHMGDILRITEFLETLKNE